MNKFFAIGVAAALLILLLAFTTTYTVAYNEVAIKRTFGQATAEDIVTEAGWHVRLPFFADTIDTLDKRLQISESPQEQLPTADGQQLVVQAYLLWKVDDEGDGPLRFANNFGSIENASLQLYDPLRSAMGAISQFRFDELIGPASRLAEAEQAILANLQSLRSKGVAPIEVGISRVVLPPKVSVAVIERMNRTRMQMAESVRSNASAEAESLRSRARTQADKILAFAQTRAAEIRALAEGQAAEYLEQMSEEPALAVFLTWLDALEATLSSYTTVVLPPDYAPWHLLNLDTPRSATGVPMPPQQNEPVLATPLTPPRSDASPAAAGEAGSVEQSGAAAAADPARDTQPGQEG